MERVGLVFRAMISLAEARASIAAHVHPLGAVTTPLAHAHGHVLREDVVAEEDFPAFDRSAMDGYAVAHDDASERFNIVGEIRPGAQPEFQLSAGECARIFTGAQMPEGSSQVIMQEDVTRDGTWMIPRERKSARHVRARGEDARTGDLLLRAGTRLRAPELALLAQVGATAPSVSPPPRVIHLVTGDELVPPGVRPGSGQIRDSNSTLVAGLLAERGARLAHQNHCHDELAALIQEVKSIPESAWDVLLISGGASVGDYDFGVEAVTKLGFHVHFRAINLRPGKPLVFATRGRQVAFVIPGNPVSHFVVFHAAIRLALERLEAAESAWELVSVALASELAAASGDRETFWPARVFADAGRLTVRPLGWRSSGDLCGLVSANALIQVLPGAAASSAGECVKCLLLDQR